MMSRSFSRRYWDGMTGADAPPSSLAVGRGRTGFTFGQRYWSSFIGVDLPARPDTAAAEFSAPASKPMHLPRRLPIARQLREGWFPLPQLPAPAGLRAGDDSDVVAEVTSPDHRVEFFVRRISIAPTRYRVEVVMREFDALPAIIVIRYGEADGERVLLVPIAQQAIGPPVSQVELPGFTGGTAWEASAQVRPDQTPWGEDIVIASIRAAVNQATRDAWRQVGEVVGDDLQRLIDRVLG